MSESLDEIQLRRLIDVGRGLLSQLDPEAVLQQVLETACEIRKLASVISRVLGAAVKA